MAKKSRSARTDLSKDDNRKQFNNNSMPRYKNPPPIPLPPRKNKK